MNRVRIKPILWGILFCFMAHGSLWATGDVTNIKVDQFGYRPEARKVAVISQAVQGFNAPESYVPSAVLKVVNAETRETVFEGGPVAWKNGTVHSQSGDKVWWFDFSEVEAPGFYYIHDEPRNKYSPVFRISVDVYNEPLAQAARMFYYQRCGVAKEAAYAGAKWQDGACHIHSGQDLACRSISARNDPATEKDLSGGWHDAGDFNKYTSFTYSTLHNLLFAYENNPDAFFDNYGIPESGNGLPDLLDEAKFELNWLLKMQLPDGSALSKVSVTQHQGASPVSQDLANRYYGPAINSATRTVASVFAHAYTVYSRFAGERQYADTLLARAEKAWQYLQDNPGYSTYNNAGFSSANPERSEYDQKAQELTAAYFLYKATGNTGYLGVFESNIGHFHALAWPYWYAFEYEYQRVLIDYCLHPDADPAVVQSVLNSFHSSMQGGEFIPAANNATDAYKAYMKDNDYVWGNNSSKSRVGCIFQDYARVSTEDMIKELARKASEDYLHFLHGVNAHGIVMLTNMDEFGAEHYAREMYHIWFADGTEYDNADTSPKGPPPGFVTGGINKNFNPDASYSGPPLEPPLNQPVQKAYRDWNTSWPENSWEVTEPAIYYQAAYIHLLSYFASDNAGYAGNFFDLSSGVAPEGLSAPAGLSVFPNPVEKGGRLWLPEGHGLQLARLYSIDGKLIRQYALNSASGYIPLDGVPSGSYILRMASGQKVETTLLIVR